jgi:hypothetical protein
MESENMADVTKILGVKNGSVAFAPVAIALTQTIVVGKDERTFVYVNNAQAAAVNTITVVKGNGIASASGDYVVAIPQAESVIIGPLESSRFVDKSTGKITITASVVTTTTIAVVQL